MIESAWLGAAIRAGSTVKPKGSGQRRNGPATPRQITASSWLFRLDFAAKIWSRGGSDDAELLARIAVFPKNGEAAITHLWPKCDYLTEFLYEFRIWIDRRSEWRLAFRELRAERHVRGCAGRYKNKEQQEGRMRRKIRKALDVLLMPPLNRNSAKRARRQEYAKKTPIVDLAARLFLAGAFIMGQPINAEPTPVISVHTRDDAFAALQDFVQTQRVAPLDFAQSPSRDQASARETSGARDPYSVLRDFVQVANSSGTVPLPMRGQGPRPTTPFTPDCTARPFRGATPIRCCRIS